MRIVGNLDVEVAWARMDAAARRARGENAPRSDDPRFALPEPVMRKISAAATLMRVFATSDDDVLWTPRPVDPSRMAKVDWLPTPRLESGPMPETADVWWGEPTETAARFNHRVFAWEVQVRCGLPRLPGGTIAYDIDDLARAAEDTLDSRGNHPWVAKAPFSAAGRLRVRGAGQLEDKQQVQAQRLLELQGVLLFEPWVRRTADYGITGVMRSDGWDNSTAHRLIVDSSGRFQGIGVPGGADAAVEKEMQAIVSQVGARFVAAGHRGPFGFDFFVTAYDGEPHVHLSEVNARRTFGHVAMALGGRLQDTEGRDVDGGILRFGRGAPTDGTIPLLLPGSDDDTCAWLETRNAPCD